MVEEAEVGNDAPKSIITKPTRDKRNGLNATFLCTRRKINETNGKNIQLNPQRMLTRNVSITYFMLPIKKMINPKI